MTKLIWSHATTIPSCVEAQRAVSQIYLFSTAASQALEMTYGKNSPQWKISTLQHGFVSTDMQAWWTHLT